MLGVKTVMVIQLFRDSVRLCSYMEGTGRLPKEEEQQIIANLTANLFIHQGVPAAVGSGKCSMKYKLHVVAHAERLVSPSWKDTAVKMNSTFTFTGDLGPERLARRYSMSL